MYNQLYRRLRDELGLSQERFAEKVGVSALMISKFETGRRTPSLKTLARMSVLCGYPLGWLCDPVLRRLALPALFWSTDSELRIAYLFGPLAGTMVTDRARFIGQSVADCPGVDSPLLQAHHEAQAGQAVVGKFQLNGHWLQVNLSPNLTSGRFMGVDAVGLSTAGPKTCLSVLPQCQRMFQHLQEQIDTGSASR